MEWFMTELPTLLHYKPKVFWQHPGDTIYLPSGWLHAVLNIQSSAGISTNRVDEYNWKDVHQVLSKTETELAAKIMEIATVRYV
jgi:hypothetical protein